jgi:nicotinate-nucleotide adenylyltransferase
MERVGLFGGTFDPIHTAHLSMAEAAREQCGLARVLLVPAANPPHRKQGAHAGFEDRYRMVEIACMGNPSLVPSRLDEGPGKSYSLLMVERFLSETRETEPYFIIGADAFAEISSWHRWRDLARLVTFAVIGRPGAEYQVPPDTRVHRVDGVNLPISSSEIRAELAAAADITDLPAGVLDYIRQHHLYR